MNDSLNSRLALTLFTLRDYAQTPAEIAQTLKKVKAIGYENVQISALGPIDPKELKKMTDGEGLNVCATHYDLDRLQNELDAIIEEHHILECDETAIPALPDDYRNQAGYEKFAREGTEFGYKLAEAGITFSYHNHWWELETFNGETGLQILFEKSDAKAFFAEIDTAWIQRGDHDPVDWIKRCSGRITLVHLKDISIKGPDEVETLPVGEGMMKWPPILEACREAGVKWNIVEQDYCKGDPFDCIERSFNFLKELGLQ